MNSQLETARKEVKGLEQRKNFKQKISARIEVEKRNLRVLLAEADLGGERRALAARIVPSVKNMVKAVRLLLVGSQSGDFSRYCAHASRFRATAGVRGVE